MDCRSLLLPVALAAAGAWAQSSTDPGHNARCATRLSVAFLGTTPSSVLLANPSPQSQIDVLMQDPAFVERFARFINATFNSMPASLPEQDAAYWLSKVILTTNQPWKQLFIGPYRVDAPDPSVGGDPQVVSDANGLGYFRSMPWEVEYAGNEEAGYKLRTAYRMMNNIIGLHLVPATNAPGADVSATGRQRAQCAGCHYNSVFALDKVARALTKRVGTGANITFAPPDPTQLPQTVLGGVQINTDADVVNALVNSTSFQFRACRLAFLYLYGRNEYTCEGPLFDACVDAFNTDGRIQSALKTVAGDATFCQ
jgi:hypothetical protein